MAKRSSKPIEQVEPESFERAVEELESLLESLERESAGLEDSLAKYERGTYLLKWCRGVLDSAQKRVDRQDESAKDDGERDDGETEDEGDDA